MALPAPPRLLALEIPPRGGRPQIDKEVRDLIRRMSFENRLWSAPKIHGERSPMMWEIAYADGRVDDFATPRANPMACRLQKPILALLLPGTVAPENHIRPDRMGVATMVPLRRGTPRCLQAVEFTADCWAEGIRIGTL